MDSTQTLHDFVLNLLSDPTALTAFQLDPEGVLNAAGLSDINALDVQEAIPLVADYAPVQSVTGLVNTGTVGTVTDLAGGALRTDQLGAIHQLTAITQQLPLTGQLTNSELNLATAGAIVGDPAGLATGLTGTALNTVGSLSGITGSLGLTSALSQTTDVTHTLDTEVVHTTIGVSGAVSSSVGITSDHLADTTNDTTGGLAQTTGGLAHTVGGTLSGVVGSTTHGLTGDLTHTLGSTTHGLTGDVTHTLDSTHLLDVGGLTGSTPLSAGTPVVGSVGDTLHGVTNHLGTGALLGNAGQIADTGHVDHVTDHSGDGHLLGGIGLF
jgi:hypothetical protein